VTHILRPGKAPEKTPKGVITPILCEILQNSSRKKNVSGQMYLVKCFMSKCHTTVINNVLFSMAVMSHGQNHQFQNDWNVSWSKLSVLVWLEYVVVKIIRAEMCHSHIVSVSAWLEYVVVKITSFSMAGMFGC
jgi:hypothetical protein